MPRTPHHRYLRTSLVLGSLLALSLGYGLMSLLSNRLRPIAVSPPRPALIIMQGKTMGSTYRVQYVAQPRSPSASSENTSTASPADVQSMVDDELDRLDLELSTWNPESTLSRFNRYRGSDWFEVTPGIIQMVSAGGELTRLSDGRYDVTVGPIVEAWGFGKRGSTNQTPITPTTQATQAPSQTSAHTRIQAPTQAELDKLLLSVGYEHLEVREQPPALRKLEPDLEIDLSSMGAGEAADRIARRLRDSGIENFFVDITGEIITGGRRPDGQPWSVGFERPELGARATVAKVTLSNMAVATSGNYRNMREIDGQRVAHTMDANTGRPLSTDILSVSVIDVSCRRADALATMLMTFTSDDALRVAAEHNWNIVLVRQPVSANRQSVQGQDQLEILHSSGAAPFLLAPPAT